MQTLTIQVKDDLVAEVRNALEKFKDNVKIQNLTHISMREEKNYIKQLISQKKNLKKNMQINLMKSLKSIFRKVIYDLQP